QRMPMHFFKDPEFIRQYDRLRPLVDWTRLSARGKRKRHKELMFEAAKFVRNLRLQRPLGETKLMVRRSMSRAVWRDDVVLGRRLLQSCELARTCLSVTETEVNLIHPPTFARDFAQEQQLHFEARSAALDEREKKAFDSTSFKAVNALRRKFIRRAALWAPFGRSLKLQGVSVPAEGGGVQVLHGQEDMMGALRDHWAPIFQAKTQVDGWGSLAERFMKEHAPKLA
ncbi:unnamed protein product, partial [Prorocentrum cordatum]